MTVTSLKTVIKFWFLDPSSGFSPWFIVTQLETKNATSEEGKAMEEKSANGDGSKCDSGKYLKSASSKAFVLSTLSCKLSETTQRSFDAMSLHLLLPVSVLTGAEML